MAVPHSYAYRSKHGSLHAFEQGDPCTRSHNKLARVAYKLINMPNNSSRDTRAYRLVTQSCEQSEEGFVHSVVQDEEVATYGAVERNISKDYHDSIERGEPQSNYLLDERNLHRASNRAVYHRNITRLI